MGDLNFRYHDGYSNCTDDTFTDCSGVLLGSYTMVSSQYTSAAFERFPKFFYIGRVTQNNHVAVHRSDSGSEIFFGSIFFIR